MPSNKHGGRGRCVIVNWRVKAGKRDVFDSAKKIDCEEFIRENKGKIGGIKLKLVSPNC